MFTLEQIKAAYPVGTRLELEHMNDPNPVAPGTLGTVESVDDVGTIQVNWDNGQVLGIILDEDKVRIIA